MDSRWLEEVNNGAPVCLIHGRVIDGLGSEPIDDGYVLIADGTIRAVGRSASYQAAGSDVRVVDVAGQTIMPGLIDAHAHLVYRGFRSLEEIDRCPVETATINALLNAEQLLRAGYTTIRDVGCIGNVAVAVRDAIAQGKVRGPRVFASGRIIGPTSGMVDNLPSHWDQRMGLGVRADGPHEIVKIVRQQIKDGVDNIKLGASGVEVGAHAYTWMTTFSEEEIRAAVHEAHRWGRTVAIHCQSYEAATYALRAGADTIEHGTRLDEEAIALFGQSHTILVPTLCTLFSVLELGEKLNLLPKQREEIAVNHPLWLDSLRRAHAAGVPIAAGADIGNRYPHGANARELEYLVRAGLTPMEALRAATSVAARVVRQADTLGALAPGRLADVLVVDGDPLADIRVLQDQARISLVMQAGRVVAGSLWAQIPATANR